MPQPKHTELSILESYLLTPSPLPTIIPYSAFLQLVPAQHRDHPHLKRLYRDLQFQRNIDVDTVRQNIEREVARSVILKSQLAHSIAAEKQHANADEVGRGDQRAKKRKRDSDTKADGDDNEFTDPTNLAIDTTYLHESTHPAHTSTTLPVSSNHPLTSATKKFHTTSSLVTALDSACLDLEAEISNLEAESAELLAAMNEIVGSLSDLRYGKFTKPVNGNTIGENGNDNTLESEMLSALKGLERRLDEVGA